MLATINIIGLTIIWFWAIYHAHVTENFLKRLSFIVICFTICIMFIFLLVPYDELYYGRQLLWQPVLLRIAWASYCIADFYCEYGTARFVEAFSSSEMTKRLRMSKTHILRSK